MSADDAVKRSWIRLRIAHRHHEENPGVKRWEAIGRQQDRLAEGIAGTIRRERTS